MKGYITILGILFLGMATTIFLANMFTQGYVKDAVVSSMVESGKTASVQALNHVSRVTENKVELSQEKFESTFEEEMDKNLNVDITIVDISYHYLITENDLKAININITDENGDVYTTNFRQNISEME